MFSEKEILNQLELQNNKEIIKFLNTIDFVKINSIKFNSKNNYYSLIGEVEVSCNLWLLKKNNQKTIKHWVYGNHDVVKERESKLLKDRKLTQFKLYCHRGHLLAKQLREYTHYIEFNYSTKNPENIYPQWINANCDRANNSEIFGQAYFERRVKEKLENGEIVYYDVEPIFAEGNRDYPIGNILIAIWDSIGEEKNILFEENDKKGVFVFIPNYLDTHIIHEK